MKCNGTQEKLEASWQLLPNENSLLTNKHEDTRLGFMLLLKFFQLEGRFPASAKEIPAVAVSFVSRKLQVRPETWSKYLWNGASIKRHRSEIRAWTGFRQATVKDAEALELWLLENILPLGERNELLTDVALERFRSLKIEPPGPERLKRHVAAAIHKHDARFCNTVFQRIGSKAISGLDSFLEPPREKISDGDSGTEWSIWQILKDDPGRASLDSVNKSAYRLRQILDLDLPKDTFNDVSPKLLERYAKRASVEEPFELRRHAEPLRATMMAAYLNRRSKELTDGLVDILLEIIHKMGKRAERRIEDELAGQFKKVPRKLGLLISMAEASLGAPKGIIDEVIFPVVPEKLLRSLLQEIASTGPAYKKTIQVVIQRSYRSHYRRMLPEILGLLEFRCMNAKHQPVMLALEVLKTNLDHKGSTYPKGICPPLDGIVQAAWMPLVVDEKDGKQQINRIAYEICVLRALRDKLRCREIWVLGSRRYRDPEEDLPKDFEARREFYCADLGLQTDAKVFAASIRAEMKQALIELDKGMPSNPNVKILPKNGGWIKLSPFDPLPEPENIEVLKSEIMNRWPMTSLLDVLKETDLQLNFTKAFQSGTGREHLDPHTLRRRLLLCLYSLGTNTGLKCVVSREGFEDYKDLLYVRRRFIFVEQLRQAISQVVNATLAVRMSHIWGHATTSCASDSKQFSSWDQNLLTEWHQRYGGRGVMVYWHVEGNSTCIYSQLKRCSSSEAAAMIEGVLRHCTEKQVDRQYVDSHGQSEVAFAFCRLLGFDLMPRLKCIHRQKLYRPESRQPEAFSNLQAILTRPINWELIEEQFDVMVKHVVALKLGTVDADTLLRRFTRTNIQNPAYRAFAELGKAIKTIFLCRYLSSEELRREINEGLNVVESWNGVNDFIRYGKGGELTSNRKEDQELSLLSLHLLQSCLVYVNTLMIQNVLGEQNLFDRMTTRDLAALTPLFTKHINPYGRLELDMEARLPIGSASTKVSGESTGS